MDIQNIDKIPNNPIPYIPISYGCFLSHGGTPIPGRFISWNILLKLMVWGSPIFENLRMCPW